MSFSTIPAKSITNYIGKQNTIIIDLRRHEEFNQGHIPTAINIPYNEFQINQLNNTNEIILYCERGNMSLLLSRRLSAQGYRVISIYGGIHAYRGELYKEK